VHTASIKNPPPVSQDPRLALLDTLLDELRKLESLQANKVIELARRLKPGLTAEDIRNPHDFPDLDDPDWHFEDGQLVGIQTTLTTIRAMRERVARGEEP